VSPILKKCLALALGLLVPFCAYLDYGAVPVFHSASKIAKKYITAVPTARDL